MASAKNNTDKINNLQRYIDKLQQQLKSPTARRKGSPEFSDWLHLEIKRASSDIEKLKLGSV